MKTMLGGRRDVAAGARATTVLRAKKIENNNNAHVTADRGKLGFLARHQ